MDIGQFNQLLQAAMGAGGSRPRAVLPTWSEDQSQFDHHKNSLQLYFRINGGELSDAQKINFLLSSIKGKSAQKIQSII